MACCVEKTPKIFACEHIRLQAKGILISLALFADQHDLHHYTLQHHLKQIMEPLRSEVEEISRLEGEEEQEQAHNLESAMEASKAARKED